MDKTYAVAPDGHVATPFPATHRIALNAPLRWLRLGARDFAAAPFVSMSYGLAFASLGLGLSYAAVQQPQLSLALLALLLVVGPFMATSLYHIPKHRQQGRDPSAESSLKALSGRRGGLAVFVALMLLITIAWIRISSLIIALYAGQLSPGAAVFAGALSGTDGLALLGLLFANLGLFAFLLFAASALSLPMVFDGKAEMIPALVTSFKTVLSQPAPMLLWAGLIAALTLAGIATLFIGLVVVFPILAYATWHSYRDLVE